MQHVWDGLDLAIGIQTVLILYCAPMVRSCRPHALYKCILPCIFLPPLSSPSFPPSLSPSLPPYFSFSLRFFSEVDICHYNPSWHCLRVQGKILPHAPSQQKVVSFHVFEPTEVSICLFQPSNRYLYVNVVATSIYSYVRFVLSYLHVCVLCNYYN